MSNNRYRIKDIECPTIEIEGEKKMLKTIKENKEIETEKKPVLMKLGNSFFWAYE
jgi:hypothetical protein